MNYKQQVVNDSIASREQEVALYEINIDNYQHAAAAASADPSMAEFAQQLKDRIVSEQMEMKKSVLILNALRAQKVDLDNAAAAEAAAAAAAAAQTP